MKTTKFKSDRAAKMAYTKAAGAAERARNAANGARWALYHNDDNSPRDGYADEEEAHADALKVEAARLWEVARTVYEAATAQGIFISSYHFGHNPTRDLIAANMD